MGLPINLVTIRLFLRIFLGLILWSAAISKLAHPRQFRHAIQEYQVIPFFLEKRFFLSVLFSFSIPGGEIIAGFGLLSGILLIPSIILTTILFFIFNAAMAFNLVRGRDDLSCHCEGALGNHQISWWLVGRNLLLIAMTSLLFFTAPDQMTLANFLREPELVHETLLSTIVPVVLVVGAVLTILWLFSYARAVLRMES